MQIKNEILYRIYGVLGFILVFAVLIVFQTLRITVIDRQAWLDKAEKYQFQKRDIEAERGNIIAEDGSLLATSLPYYDVHFDTKAPTLTNEIFDANVQELAMKIVQHFDTTYTVGAYIRRLETARLESERYLPIAKGVDQMGLELMKTFPIFNRGRYKGGLIAEKRPKRKRPFGILAHRSVGYVRETAEDTVKVGLEGRFDDVLGGKAGKQLMRRIKGNDGKGIWIPAEDISEIPPVEGMDIKTTIDVNLQDITEQALLRGLQKSKGEFGVAILMEVETGAIRAIANLGKTSQGWWEDYNYAVGRRIEPGSTFKLATAMALMEEGAVDLDDTVDVFQGRRKFYEEEMVDASYQPAHRITFRQAFEKSSNVGLAYLVDETYKREPDKFIGRIKQFNLDLPTNIEINGEKPPYIKDPDNEDDLWSGVSLPWMSIGYELLITPLQLVTFYNAVANDGKMMKPYVVEEIIKDGGTEAFFKPVIVDASIATPETIEKAKVLLEGVVENGTAKKLKTDMYRFAGKTGTAQVDYSRRADMKHQASFVGYFPAERPIYTCIVVVNDPKEGSIYGGDVAGPIFREIADKTFSSKINLRPPMNGEFKPGWKTYALPDLDVGEKREMEYLLGKLGIPYRDDSPSDWIILRAKSDSLRLESRRIPEELVPNVLGMGLRDAMFILENKGLRVTVSGRGKVRKQSVPAGRKITGQTVHIELG